MYILYMINYKNKYLKYKQKYINYKKYLSGGVTEYNTIDLLKTMLDNNEKITIELKTIDDIKEIEVNKNDIVYDEIKKYYPEDSIKKLLIGDSDLWDINNQNEYTFTDLNIEDNAKINIIFTELKITLISNVDNVEIEVNKTLNVYDEIITHYNSLDVDIESISIKDTKWDIINQKDLLFSDLGIKDNSIINVNFKVFPVTELENEVLEIILRKVLNNRDEYDLDDLEDDILEVIRDNFAGFSIGLDEKKKLSDVYYDKEHACLDIVLEKWYEDS